jgi:hypothetical protein
MSEVHLKQIEADFNKLRDDLKNHKNGIFEKLQLMLNEKYVFK